MANSRERILIGAAFCLCSLAAACFEPTPEPRYSIGPKLKEYFDYKVSSYWIYRDSGTGISDTVEVRNKSMDMSSSYDIYTIGSVQKSNKYWRGIIVRPNLVTYRITDTTTLQGVDYNITQGFPFNIGETTINTPGTHLTRLHASYTIDSKSYDDVYEIVVKKRNEA